MNQPAARDIDFLSLLRKETSTLHRALENTVLSVSLMSNDLTRNTYTRYLAAMAPVMEWYDVHIIPMVMEIIPDAGDRNKLPALVTDLGYLTGNTAISEVAFAPPQIDNSDAAMGAAYVIEGSTLGGQFILKHAAPKLNLDASHGASYFTGYGSATGIKWKSFLATLTSFASNGNQHAIIGGANNTFESILRHFNKYGSATTIS